MQYGADGLGLEVDLSRERGIVVDSRSAEQPRSVHVADERGLEVSLDECPRLAHQRRVDHLDARDRRVRHAGAAAAGTSFSSLGTGTRYGRYRGRGREGQCER